MLGTAQNGVDYDLLSGSAVIPAVNSRPQSPFVPLADNLIENLETVVLRLEGPATIPYRSEAERRGSHQRYLSSLGPDGTGWTGVTDGCFHGALSAPAGGNFRIEASTDLLTWETVATTAATESAVHFVEDEAANLPARFYRLAPEPAAGAVD
jgi:hypothetical protein